MNKLLFALCALGLVGHASAAAIDRCTVSEANEYPVLPNLSQSIKVEPLNGPAPLRGAANLSVNQAAKNDRIKDITVFFPAGSYDPGSMTRLGKPYGGIEFKSPLKSGGRDCLVLSYRLKFDDNFDFVKGGKLPGLYGGKGNTGGKIPNGSDGFSTRYIWKERGAGSVYAYLPTSETWGTAIGQGSWRFEVGQWHSLEQLVQLNTPGNADGVVNIWYDQRLVHSETGLMFRSTADLKIDGLLFSTFFGGNNASFATPVDTHIQFRDFVLSAHRIKMSTETR